MNKNKSKKRNEFKQQKQLARKIEELLQQPRLKLNLLIRSKQMKMKMKNEI